MEHKDFLDLTMDQVFDIKMVLLNAECALKALAHCEPEMYEAFALEDDLINKLKDARKIITDSASFTFDKFTAWKYYPKQ